MISPTKLERGNQPKGDITPKVYLVKSVTRGGRRKKSLKMGDIIYGRSLRVNMPLKNRTDSISASTGSTY